MTEPRVQREDLELAIETRKELGVEREPEIVEQFLERIDRRLAEHDEQSERALKSKRDHQRDMILGSMGISIPLLIIAAVFTGLGGVIVVCAALAVIAVVVGRAD
jgi:hypothetical protein